MIQFVLIPGLHGTKSLFEPLLKILPAKVFELPKSGPQDYETLSAWLSSQSFPKSYILVAESFGGPLGLLHAARRPVGLKGLVLLGSFARVPLFFRRLLSYLIPPLPLGSRLCRAANQHMLFSGEASQAQMDFFQKDALGTSPWIFRARMRAILLGDVTAALPRIKVPLLSLRGTRDRMVNAAAEKDFQGMARRRLLTIDGPHVLAGTRPAEVAGILRAFRKTL